MLCFVWLFCVCSVCCFSMSFYLTISVSSLSGVLYVNSIWWTFSGLSGVLSFRLCLIISVSALSGVFHVSLSDYLCFFSAQCSLCLLCLMLSVSALSHVLCVCFSDDLFVWSSDVLGVCFVWRFPCLLSLMISACVCSVWWSLCLLCLMFCVCYTRCFLFLLWMFRLLLSLLCFCASSAIDSQLYCAVFCVHFLMPFPKLTWKDTIPHKRGFRFEKPSLASPFFLSMQIWTRHKIQYANLCILSLFLSPSLSLADKDGWRWLCSSHFLECSFRKHFHFCILRRS